MLRFASNLPYWIVNDLLRTSPRRLLRRITGLLRREQGQGQTEDCGINVERVFGVRELPAKRVEFIRSLYQAWLNYKPRRYPGRVTLLRARCRPLFNRHNRMLGWDQVADGGVEMWVAPGSHDSLFDANHVHRIAALLTRCLDRGAGHDALSVALAPAH